MRHARLPRLAGGMSDFNALKQCIGFPQTSHKVSSSQVSFFRRYMGFLYIPVLLLFYIRKEQCCRPMAAKYYEKSNNQYFRQHIPAFYHPKTCPHCNGDSNYLYTCTILRTDSNQPRTDFAYESGSPNQRLCTRLERRYRQLSHLPSDRRCRIASLLRFRRRPWQNRRANGRISGRLHLHDHNCRIIRRAFSG